MSSLVNYDENISIQLAPVSYNEFGVMCSLEVKTELICLDFKNVNEVNRYMSYENITYLQKQLTKLDNLDQFEEEDELVFLVRGEAIIEDGDNRLLEMEAGELLYLQAGLRHRVKECSDDCLWLCFFFPPQEGARFFNQN